VSDDCRTEALARIAGGDFESATVDLFLELGYWRTRALLRECVRRDPANAESYEDALAYASWMQRQTRYYEQLFPRDSLVPRNAGMRLVELRPGARARSSRASGSSARRRRRRSSASAPERPGNDDDPDDDPVSPARSGGRGESRARSPRGKNTGKSVRCRGLPSAAATPRAGLSRRGRLGRGCQARARSRAYSDGGPVQTRDPERSDRLKGGTVRSGERQPSCSARARVSRSTSAKQATTGAISAPCLGGRGGVGQAKNHEPLDPLVQQYA